MPLLNDAAIRRRRAGIAALIIVAAAAAGIESWSVNVRTQDRAAANSAIVRPGADDSTRLTANGVSGFSIPVRNDSPYPITVIGLSLPAAGNLHWDGRHLVIPAGQTAYLAVRGANGCAVALPPQVDPSPGPSPADVILRVDTIDGKPHGGLRLGINGALAYAVKECGIPVATASYVS